MNGKERGIEVVKREIMKGKKRRFFGEKRRLKKKRGNMRKCHVFLISSKIPLKIDGFL